MVHKTPGKSLLGHMNQQHIHRCYNFSFVSSHYDLFGANLRMSVTGLVVHESYGLPFVEIIVWQFLEFI